MVCETGAAAVADGGYLSLPAGLKTCLDTEYSVGVSPSYDLIEHLKEDNEYV